MAKFPRKADLLAEVQTAGQNYLTSVRNSTDNQNYESPKLYNFNSLVLNERARARGNFIITHMMTVPETDEHAQLMDAPVFTWNESLDDPVVYRTDNELINSADCFPPSLTTLAMDYVDQGYGNGETIYDNFVQKVGALFFNQATPRDFQIDANHNGVALHFPDPKSSPPTELGHVASGQLLYDIMQENGLPAFDIHDITHHASQMAQYGDFYQWLTKQATDEVITSPEKRLQKRLVRSALLTTLEHSIVASEHGTQSFGCLNWQAPRKSILSTGVSKRNEYRVNDYVFGAQDINLWSSIRAIASIYREQLEAEELAQTKLDWMRELGYDMDKELLARVQPGTSYDYSDLTFDSARRAHIKVPFTPEELFDNTRALVEAN